MSRTKPPRKRYFRFAYDHQASAWPSSGCARCKWCYLNLLFLEAALQHLRYVNPPEAHQPEARGLEKALTCCTGHS